MILRLPAQHGVKLEAVASGYPADVDEPQAVDLDNAAALRALLGERLEEVLAQRGWDLDHPARAWGVERRGWTRGRRAGALELALAAARTVLERARRGPGELDAVVVATSTPTRVSASLSARLAVALGTEAACFDVRAGGAGGLNALLTASGLLAQGAQRVLVVAVEVPSRFLDASDLSSALLFGDGASALLLATDPQAGGGLVGAVSGNQRAAGRSFSVAGELDSEARGPLLFQRPDATYREELQGAWRTALDEARELGVADGVVHPYAVTRDQLERLSARLACDLSSAHATLKRRGALGCAGALAVFVDWIERRADNGLPEAGREHLLCAVGGGISWTVVRWRT